jgi:hypothetical protein
MVVYRDMTFCSFHEHCKDGKTCQRAMTDEVMKKANEIGLPICRFTNKPDCFVEKLQNSKETLEAFDKVMVELNKLSTEEFYEALNKGDK